MLDDEVKDIQRLAEVTRETYHIDLLVVRETDHQINVSLAAGVNRFFSEFELARTYIEGLIDMLDQMSQTTGPRC